MTKQESITEQALEEGTALDDVPLEEDVPPQSKKSWKNGKAAVITAFLIVIALALAIGLGVGLSSSSNDNNDETIQTSTVTEPNDEDVAPVVDDTTEDPPLVLTPVRISDATTRSLSLVSEDTFKNTYLDCDDLAVDLRKVTLLLANQTIQSHLQSYYFATRGFDGPIFFPPVSAPAPAPVPAPSPGIETTEDSFETNNQLEGVEEPDILKSDGVDIFAVYGAEVRFQAHAECFEANKGSY